MHDESVLERIERLERSNRMMKYFCAVTLLLCLAATSVPEVFSAFPHGPRQVNAQRYNLVTRRGQLVATLGTGPNGGFLAFYDSNQKPEVLVGTSSSADIKSVGVALFDGNELVPGNGSARVIMAEEDDATSQFAGQAVLGPDGKARLTNATGIDGSIPGTFFYDGSATLRGGFALGPNGPAAYLNDSNGHPRVLESIAGDDASASVALLDASQEVTAVFSAMGDDSTAGMQLLDPNGTPRLQSVNGSTTEGPEILINNSTGNTVWFAPEAPGT